MANVSAHLLLNGAWNLQNCKAKYICQSCQVDCVSPANLGAHLKGSKHRKKVSGHLHTVKCGTQGSSAGQDPGPQRVHTLPAKMCCEICDEDVPTHQWKEHLTTSRHSSILKADLDESERDQNGIQVSEGATDIDLGIIQVDSAETKKTFSVKNTNATDFFLREARLSALQSSAGTKLVAHVFRRNEAY